MNMDGVSHIEHPRPSNKYDHQAFLNFLEIKRRELIFLLNAAGKSDAEFVSLGTLVGIEK
jgi:hypothetical protein